MQPNARPPLRSTDVPSRPTRRYDNSRRAAEARATRARIVDAAATRFASSGYAATSVRTIAEAAGTSAETVYAVFGSKSAVLRAWIDRAVVGDDEELALLDREEAVAALSVGTIAERRRAQFSLIRRINERVAVPMRVLAGAAHGDPELTSIVGEYERRRRSDIEAFARALIDGPRTDRSFAKLVDLLAVWTSAEVYARLVIDRGWTAEEYERELAAVGETVLDRPSADG